ncbi:hypothetical protein PMZ80_007949 [Knufia obscura]|uniref:Uncharacterized protein n=1 Tax=Knufia obscura TaxID=1635080 RepID=A0ABR0RG56_9EURO|nr:hypothetical protein PMZ80_007949 [Knufia obscura]
MSKPPSDFMNFTPDPSAPPRRDYAREYAEARNRASNISAKSHQQHSRPPTPVAPPANARPHTQATRPQTQGQSSGVQASYSTAQDRPRGPTQVPRPSVQPHPQAQRPPKQAHTARPHRRYVLKAEYTFADFEAIPFGFTDEIAHRFNHAWWLTDPRNIPEVWMLPKPSRPMAQPPTTGLLHPSDPHLTQPSSALSAAVVKQTGPGPRMQQARPQTQAMPLGPSTVHTSGVAGHAQPASTQAQRSVSIINISDDSDEGQPPSQAAILGAGTTAFNEWVLPDE